MTEDFTVQAFGLIMSDLVSFNNSNFRLLSSEGVP